MPVVWSVQATEDVDRIVAYISVENPIAARRIARELFLPAESLTMFPRRGRMVRKQGWHELLAVRPYVIVYKVVEDDSVEILRIWHGAQDRYSDR